MFCFSKSLGYIYDGCDRYGHGKLVETKVEPNRILALSYEEQRFLRDPEQRLFDCDRRNDNNANRYFCERRMLNQVLFRKKRGKGVQAPGPHVPDSRIPKYPGRPLSLACLRISLLRRSSCSVSRPCFSVTPLLLCDFLNRQRTKGESTPDRHIGLPGT